MTPINLLWNILINTFQIGVDIANQPIYLDKSRIQIENQENFIKPTRGLEVVLKQISPSRQIGIDKQITNLIGGGLTETITILYQSVIAVEILSKDSAAVTLKDNLMIYLNSYISQNLQNQNGMYVAELSAPYPVSLSQIEGADRLNRFRIDVTMNHTNTIVYNVPYYDKNFIPQVIFN